MTDTILPKLNPSNLTLSDVHIPHLIEMFTWPSNKLRSMKISSLKLRGCKTVDYSLTLWLSNQSELKTLKFTEEGLEKSELKSADFIKLRDFLFIKGLPTNVTELSFHTSIGFVLHNQLKSSITSQINYAFLQLDTIHDLQLLLNKGLLGNASKLHIHVKQNQRRCKL
jgi:hypothetical protein